MALFQPGEETATGARSMVADGLVGRVPKPDVALSQHVLTAPESGHVGTTAGPVLSAGDSIRITVYGKGSHGSMPHLGRGPGRAGLVHRRAAAVDRRSGDRPG